MTSIVILIVYGCLLIAGLMRFKKSIICPSCGESYQYIPNQALGGTQLLLFVGIVAISFFDVKGSISIVDYIICGSGLFYLCKQDKLRCPKCQKLNNARS